MDAKAHERTIKKKRFVDFKQIMSKPKPSKKSKSTRNDDGAGPLRDVEEDDKMVYGKIFKSYLFCKNLHFDRCI